jgi:hypothetical protein
MTTLMQSLRKKGSLFLLSLGALMLAVSISSAAGELSHVTPTCDGHTCRPSLGDRDCGSQCVCNPDGVCLDNTPNIN